MGEGESLKLVPEEAGPRLPPQALKLLNRLRDQQPLTDGELVNLMDILAQQATEHYRLEHGKFVAITFDGKIVELADTKLDLLRRIQSGRFSDQIFVWRVGYESFSGRR